MVALPWFSFPLEKCRRERRLGVLVSAVLLYCSLSLSLCFVRGPPVLFVPNTALGLAAAMCFPSLQSPAVLVRTFL